MVKLMRSPVEKTNLEQMKNLLITARVFLLSQLIISLQVQSKSEFNSQKNLVKSNTTGGQNRKYQLAFGLWNSTTNKNQAWEKCMYQLDIKGGFYVVVFEQPPTIRLAAYSNLQYFYRNNFSCFF